MIRRKKSWFPGVRLDFYHGAPGKFLFGYFSDAIAKHRVMLTSSLVLLLGCLTLFEPGGGDFPFELTRSVPRLVVFTVLFGLGLGGSFTMIQLVTVESFGQRARGKILASPWWIPWPAPWARC